MVDCNKFILINSFDRSGSSMLQRILSYHPQIEVLFNPFNSTIFRDEILNYWKPSYINNEAKLLIDDVFTGNFSSERIKSHWFKNNIVDFDKEKFYVVKTNNFHFKLDWLKANFPELDFYALFRNPLDILISLHKNNFIEEWYSGWAFKELHYFFENPKINIHFNHEVINYLKTDISKMFFLILVSHAVILEQTHTSNRITYESILGDVNAILNSIITKKGLIEFDFSPYIDVDYNLIGESFDAPKINKLDYFEDQQNDALISIFESFNFTKNYNYTLFE